MGQLVLACKSSLIQKVGGFQGFSLEVNKLLWTILEPENNFFLNRDRAENSPEYKQLIPYVVLRYGDAIFSYVRGKKSSEARLVAMRSIGVGGHIEPIDQSLFSSDCDMYLEAARREVNEEVKLDTIYREQVVAIINDDSTEVGKVHLGIMHIWDVAEPNVTKREGLITQAGFVHIEELKKNLDELETWSQIALQVLEHPTIPRWSAVIREEIFQEAQSDL